MSICNVTQGGELVILRESVFDCATQTDATNNPIMSIPQSYFQSRKCLSSLALVNFLYCFQHAYSLVDTLQLETVPGNLVVDLVRLARDTSNVFILGVDFGADCTAELVEALGHGV